MEGMIFVTNTNKDNFRDSYAGVEYLFEPNRPTMIPYSAAKHIFGYDLSIEKKQEDGTWNPEYEKVIHQKLARLGKNFRFRKLNGETYVEDTIKEGWQWLHNFKFEDVEYRPKSQAELKSFKATPDKEISK